VLFRLAAALTLASLVPSCTLAGGAIGSTVPNYAPVSVRDARDGIVGIGEEISIVRASDGVEVAGKFRGLDAAGLEVDTGDRLVTIDPSDVRSMSIAQGTYWTQGAAIGLAVDVAIAVWAGTRLGSPYPDTSSAGNVHVGADGITVGAH
jgi:hypothetical protein